ncbi:hypothetical protein [Inquilinus sp. Marseille-Q2685]|uniref:hypothetical protein n=1 Tax=Inquilinus sp. Marseille-Q2685 TaxID=2866581 RepID=UPI001CE3C722|nr:hypothetical protein [Inquilinus sp. Marseille-Q2685]
MLVYGDAVRVEEPGQQLGRVAAALDRARDAATGLDRHDRLVEALIEAGAFAQGAIDAEFEAAGRDAPSPLRDAATALLMELAAALRRSWAAGFAEEPENPALRRTIDGLARQALPGAIRCRLAEGFAFYALYPEAYLEAAVRAGLRPPRVIGIRSIGLTLGAVVAEACGAHGPASVRPVGHPFRRELAVDPGLAADILRDPAATYAVVDEGPGLSGSSFGAVADWLEAHGVDRTRIRFFPGHGGEPGPQASPAHRERWRSAARHVVDFDTLALRPRQPWHGLGGWIEDLVGGPGRLEDLSGGAWREGLALPPGRWPPAHRQQERRKFRLDTGGRRFLMKFAGLGRHGRDKLRRAQALHDAGFGAEPVGCRRGFLVERWIEDARPLDPRAGDRHALLRRLAAYLGFRARRFPAAPESGATLSTLAEMLCHNATEALGEEAGRAFGRLARAAGRLEGRVRRVETDNRLHRWEWLLDRHGTLLKTDAVDHCAAHDLVGCQDIAWDVAGAAVEFDLNPEEAGELERLVGHEARQPVDPELSRVLAPCYAAFQLGAFTMARDAAADDPDEAARLDREVSRYTRHLRRFLSCP